MDNNPKILIIEDDPYISSMYVTKLEREGFKTSVAMDGEEGLAKAKEEPDLILLDLILPKLSGIDLLKQLKADENLKAIPVIILTNVGDEKEIKKGLTLGACDYIIKAQFPPKEVVEKIKKVLEGTI